MHCVLIKELMGVLHAACNVNQLCCNTRKAWLPGSKILLCDCPSKKEAIKVELL